MTNSIVWDGFWGYDEKKNPGDLRWNNILVDSMSVMIFVRSFCGIWLSGTDGTFITAGVVCAETFGGWPIVCWAVDEVFFGLGKIDIMLFVLLIEGDSETP